MKAPSPTNDPQRVFATSLLALEGPECTIPKCRAAGRMRPTGWLVRVAERGEWTIEFTCSDHGRPRLSMMAATNVA